MSGMRSYNVVPRELLMKMIRHALHKGYWEPYNACRTPVNTSEEYFIKKSKDRSYLKYRCVDCANIFRSSEIKRDHIEPIISIYDAENGIEDILERAFCGIENLQLLCKGCHDIKSRLENALRRQK
jgi:5-methylcytosine-specific restriction endonuclease McrA